MIGIRLEGGLGNQMFQYALGKHVAVKNGTGLLFDIESYKTNPIADCSYWLEWFNIDIKDHLLSAQQLRQIKRYRRRHGRRWAWHNLIFANKDRYIEEKSYAFDPAVLSAKNDSYLHGWWQSEKYFLPIRDSLLKDFEPRAPLAGRNKETAERMSATNSVAMHIRRLDYVKNPKTRRFHGELPKSYYDEALKVVAERSGEPLELFVISDDPEWVAAHMPFPYPTTHITWNHPYKAPYEDMRLMSLCRHAVTANSSFGWWGAWLNQNKEKIVVAPAHWVAGMDREKTEDVVPDAWVKLEPNYILD